MREKSRVQGINGFDFAPHWLKSWQEILKSISSSILDSHLKTGLYVQYMTPNLVPRVFYLPIKHLGNEADNTLFDVYEKIKKNLNRTKQLY